MSGPEDIGRVARRRWRVGLGLALTLISASVGVDRVGLSIPSNEIALWGAFALLLTGVASGCRNLIQRKIGYGHWVDPNPAWTLRLAIFLNPFNPNPWTPTHRARLSRLTAINGRIAVTLLVAGLWFLAHPDNLIELCVGMALGGIFMAATFETNDLLHVPGAPPRATDRIEECKSVRATRRRLKEMKTAAPFLLAAYDFLVSRTPQRELSGCAVVLMLMCPMVAVAQVVAVAPAAVELIVPKKQGSAAPTPMATPTRAPAPRTATPGRAVAPSSPYGPSYEALCGQAASPGAGAPPAQRAELNRVWVPLGGTVAGCAERARRVPGTDVYYVLGYRDGRFVSIAVAAPGRKAAVLLGPPAELGRRLAEAGTLRGASARQDIGPGDFHVIDTDSGAWVVIRDDWSSDSAYVELPPELADLWLRYGERFERSWPRRAGTPGHFAFYDEHDRSDEVAEGLCVGNARCELRSPDVTWKAADVGPPQAVTVERVLRDAPGSP